MDYWIYLALLSGFGQALGWALKKKTLENKGVNHTLGFISFFVAGIVLLFIWFMSTNGAVPPISQRFVIASAVVILSNILAVWAAYRALDQGELSKLMPFIALTSLAIIPIEYLLRDILPNFLQIIGIVLVVCGAIVFAFKEKITKDSLLAIKYFGVTLICYSIASPYMGVMVEESKSGLFSGAIAHIGIAIGFLVLVLISKEISQIKILKATHEWRKIFFLMVISGLVVALFENGPANIALENGSASEVFALKRTMPFFALILGIMMFNEKVTRRHLIGTALLVLGSAMIIWFR